MQDAEFFKLVEPLRARGTGVAEARQIAEESVGARSVDQEWLDCSRRVSTPTTYYARDSVGITPRINSSAVIENACQRFNIHAFSPFEICMAVKKRAHLSQELFFD